MTRLLLGKALILLLQSGVFGKQADQQCPFDVIPPPIEQDSFHEFHSCPPLRPRSSPVHVKDLRIDDFGVVMGIGDSVMAGLNSDIPLIPEMTNPKCRKLIKKVESRGASFASGGDAKFSVANGIKKYNPNVIGLSYGASEFEFCYGPICPMGTFLQPFNVPSLGLSAAQSGAWVTRCNIDNQFKYYDLFYKSKFVSPDAVDPWKLMLFLMGFNNLCLSCLPDTEKYIFSPDIFEQNVRYALDNAKKRFDKMVVVLFGLFSVSKLKESIQKDPIATQIRKLQAFSCPCMSDESFKMNELTTEYNKRLQKIALDYQSDTFAVIYEGGLSTADLSNVAAQDALSGTDAFHPNQKTHGRIAANIWNSLVGSSNQTTDFDFSKPVKLQCPTDDSRILS